MDGNWLPIVVGLAIILFALATVRLAPDSAWGQELRRSYGVRPTGSRGNLTRRDHVRAAGLAAIVATLLELTSFGAAMFGERYESASRGEVIAATYTIAAFMLAGMAMVSMFRSLWKASVWRIELPDTPAHRRGLANAIDHLLDGQLSPEERAEFLDVRYVHPQLEQIRRATVKLAAQHQPSGIPDGFRSQIKAWTAGIRESAGPA
jgi:hypothetical protein